MHRFGHPKKGLPLKTVPASAFILAVALIASAAGCASSKMATLRPVPKSPLVETLQLTAKDGPQPSSRTKQFLRVSGLEDDLGSDPRRLLEKVQALIQQEPSADKVYAFAELSYLEAKKAESLDPQLALDLYGASVLHAYQYLFDDRFRRLRNPYDPQFRGACDLYNGALEGGLRIVCRNDGLSPGASHTIRTASGIWDIVCVLRSGQWRPEEIDHFQFVSDYEIKGLKNHYHTYGLGVPLIAVRRSYPNEPVAAKYYPPGLSFPVTAFLRPVPGTDPDGTDLSARHRGELELYDPLTTSDITVGDLVVPLESDLTTPLAYFLSNPAMSNLDTIGLLRPDMLLELRPDRPEPIMGLYMAQAYEPGKIPVLFVHGLWSSPMTWMEMFNDLRSSPEIRKHYQFWFYLYPTAEPFWLSAARLRRDMAAARQVLDPYHREPALDQMVLIGHSMGGLVARLQTIDSQNDFWGAVSDQPFHLVKAKPDVRRRIAACFFFQPNPSIRRVITIGTPHRGTSFSNLTTQWIANKLIQLPKMFVQSQHALFRENRELIRDDRLLTIETSVDSLAPDSPFFNVMLTSRRAPWVKYHNIVGLVPDRGLLGKLAAGSDGLVTYESAHMDDVESELTIRARHSTLHAHPLAVLEVRRLLLAHLAELRAFPVRSPVRVAAAPRPPAKISPPISSAVHPPAPPGFQDPLRRSHPETSTPPRRPAPSRDRAPWK